jgi:hypothetical protein
MIASLHLQVLVVQHDDLTYYALREIHLIQDRSLDLAELTSAAWFIATRLAD